METIDPNIALGVKPLQIENPMAQYAMLSQLQAGQNQNALAQYQLAASKRAEESQNIQNQLYAKHYNAETGQVNKQGLMADLASQNQGVLIPKLQAQFTEEEHKQNVNKKTVEDTKTAAIKNIREKTSDLQFNPSDDNIRAHAQDAVLHGVWTQAQADQNVKLALALPMDQRPAYFAKQGLDAEKRVTTTETNRANLQKEETAKGQLKVSQGQLGVSQANLAINQNKALREQTMGTIPSGYRLNKQTNELEAIPGGPTTVTLPPKELQKREATFPQATSAVKAIETKSDSFIRDLEKLRDHPGLNQITGLVQGRLPGVTGEGRAAQALYDKIVAKGGFQALQDLRDASKTGGALGNVSNQEGKQLTASFAAISRVQDAKDVKAAIDQAIDDIKGTKTRVREAYDQTYEYKNKSGTNSVDDLLEKYK